MDPTIAVRKLAPGNRLRAGAYVLGCFATGYYLVRARTGKDLRDNRKRQRRRAQRRAGSGQNRFYHHVAGRFRPRARWPSGLRGEWTGDNHLALLAVLAVVGGHLWPAQLRFHGGKGVATSLGALLVFDYRVALMFLVLFLAGFVLTRKTLFPAMFAFACLPMADWWFNRDNFTVALLTVLAAMILFAHRRNLAEEMAALAARRTRGGLQTRTAKIMSAQEPLVFKFATEDWEFEQIHRLNYKTFVEEIPQHQPSADRSGSWTNSTPKTRT